MVEPLLSPRSFLTFLREHPLIWLGLMALVLGLLVWIARDAASVPESPFQYRL